MSLVNASFWRQRLTAGAAGVLLLAASPWVLAQSASPDDAKARPHHAAMGHQMAHGGGGHGMGMGMGMGPMGAGRQLDRVGATADQKTRIHAIFKAAHDELGPQRDTMHKLHQQMAQAMAQPVVNAAAVEALRQQVSTNRDAISKRVTQAMVDAGTVLTPEQRQKMAEQRSQRREMHERHRNEMRQLDSPKG